jgi:Xaa-Pro aminopeptidase
MQAEYQQRREQVMAKIGNGTAIFGSAPPAVMHRDVEHNFRQDSDLFYLTGLNEPESVAVLAPHHSEHRFILFVRPKDWSKEVWSGSRIGVDAAKEKFGADAVYPIEELQDKLPQYLAKAERIYYHLGHNTSLNQTIIDCWRQLLATYHKRGTGPIAIEDPAFIMYSLRIVKSAAELDLMRQAIAISVDAHNLAQEIVAPGRYEYEIQAEMEHIFRLRGGMGPAYPSIVASGANSCILHYVDNNRQMQAGELLLIDAGCCYEYYNADITRTFPVSGDFTAEQKIIYELVLEAQQEAISQVKPGNTHKQFHDTAVRVITEGLVSLGLLRGDVNELIEKETYKTFYMHGTGHWLGLDVHDSGMYRLGEEVWQSFHPNQVITVEPGIYIGLETQPAEEQPEIDPRWRGIGVRIEDDVLVTPEGQEVLTAGVPK